MLYFLALSILVIATIIAFNFNRTRQGEKNYLLKPNCLLTRHPIVLLSGFKSLFYFGRYYNQIPDFLKQHGYEVIELDLDWRSKKIRQNQLQAFIDMSKKAGLSYHFFADQSIEDELNYLKANGESVVSSINTIEESKESNQNSWDFIIKLHNLWLYPRKPISSNFVSTTNNPKVHEQVLRQAIHLAEYELR